jgi:RNA polymerase sigma factor (sigma-70 family)
VGRTRRDAGGLGDDASDVLERARRGDQEAWRRLYAAYAGRVAGYLRVQGAAEAEDLTSEIFLAVFRHLHDFRGDEPHFRSWLFVIAHRRLIDERRKLSRRDEVPLEDTFDLPADTDAEGHAFARIGSRKVEDLCDRLVPDQRDVLLLRLVADLTIEQAADVVGKSIGATKALQRRGLASLARLTEREGVPL